MKLLHNDTVLLMGLEKVNLGLPLYSKVEVIGCNCTGTDHLDWKEIKKRKIKVLSLKGETKFLESIPATAELTMALMLSLMRNIPRAFESVLAGEWDRESFKGRELKRKKILIVGHGRIGKMITKYALAFGMESMYVDKKNRANLCNVMEFEEPDIVTLHIPLEGNGGYFDKSCFNAMKKGSYLCNTSRGAILDEQALLEALKKGKIAGAALDVVQGEPNINPDLIDYALDNDNLILTPHLGGCTFESVEATETFIAKKVKEFINNKK